MRAFDENAVRSACQRVIDHSQHLLQSPHPPGTVEKFRAATDLAYLVLDILGPPSPPDFALCVCDHVAIDHDQGAGVCLFGKCRCTSWRNVGRVGGWDK